MRREKDEYYWYSSEEDGWKLLLGQLIKICFLERHEHHRKAILRLCSEKHPDPVAIEKTVLAFVDAIAKDLWSRIHNIPGSSLVKKDLNHFEYDHVNEGIYPIPISHNSMWSYGLRLLGDCSALVQRVLDDKSLQGGW